MKSNSLIILVAAIFLFTNCGDNKAATNEKQQANNSSEKKEGATPGSSAQSDDIVGEWKLNYIAIDENRNKQLDENEIKNSRTQVNDYYNDYLKFNADGSCLFSKAKSKGKYKIEDESGQSKLYINDLYNNEAYNYTIFSVSKDELRLGYYGDENSFLVFKGI